MDANVDIIAANKAAQKHAEVVKAAAVNTALYVRDKAVPAAKFIGESARDTAKIAALSVAYIALFAREQVVATARTIASLRQPAQRIVTTTAGSAAHKFKRAAAYASGFAQGLVRSPNA